MLCLKCSKNWESNTLCDNSECPYAHSNSLTARVPSYGLTREQGLDIVNKLLKEVEQGNINLADLNIEKDANGYIIKLDLFTTKALDYVKEQEIKVIEDKSIDEEEDD